jgi:predicted short-subunit dehydrogenase-like oxidoreductase (DUF2520 family)
MEVSSMQEYSIINREIISFIGAGRVGRVLARVFHNRGFRISMIIDRDLPKALACQKECEAMGSSSDSGELTSETSILFITVPDDEIPGVVEKLSRQSSFGKGTVITHTSGLLSSSILSTIQQPNVALNSVHPCFSFTEGYQDSLEGVYFAVEGNVHGYQKLCELIHAIGGKTFSIAQEKKSLYHAACTIASNYLVALFGYAEALMNTIDADNGMSYLYPLIEGTMENIHKKGLKNALTGPIIRGDIGTVEKHLSALHHENQEFVLPYIALGEWALNIADNIGGDPKKLARIRELFKQYLKSGPIIL